MDITSIIGSASSLDLPADNTYHLPSPLTRLQKNLVEVLLQLHKSNIENNLQHEKNVVKKEESDSNVNGESSRYLSDTEMSQLLVHNWQSVLSHPYLLVEHFIPKKLILMESSPTLIRDSGKFEKFDELINKLEKFKYNVIVVAKTIKELDLVESYLLGRRLNFKRYTGASLYEINNYQESSNRLNSSHHHHSGTYKRKRSDDYVPKISKNNPQLQYLEKNPKDKLTLHLFSSNQLKTINLNENLKFNFIISFDAMLSNMIYFRQLRSCDDKLIPLIKIVLFNTIEHWKLLGETDLQNLISRSIVSRDESVPDFHINLKWLENYSSEEWAINLGNLSTVPNNQDVMNKLSFQPSSGLKKLKIERQMTLNDYKLNLTWLIKNNISQVSELIVNKNIELNPVRANQSAMQRKIEETNVKIGESVKLKQSLEVDLNALTKRVERLDSDLSKLENLKQFKTSILQNPITETIEIDDTELETLNKLNEEIRLNYQLASSKLLESSMKLKLITNENDQMKLKLDDKTQELIATELQNNFDSREKYFSQTLQRQNEFLVSYNNKINAIVRNNNIVDSGNGRTTNGRLSRSTTPRI